MDGLSANLSPILSGPIFIRKVAISEPLTDLSRNWFTD